jgi:long-chain acyl-CoA synthetase
VAERLKRRPVVELLFVMVAWFTRLVSRLLFRLQGEGLHHLPHRYPLMICPNHLSFLDAFFVVALLPARITRRSFFLGYSHYFSQGLVGFLGRLIKTIPVDSETRLRQALRLAAEGLKRDLVLCVFPEGERSIDGTLKPFRKGPAVLATTMNVSVVPAGIRGSFEVWRRGSGRIRLHSVKVRFGEPIRPQAGESPEQFNTRLQSAVEGLLVTL